MNSFVNYVGAKKVLLPEILPRIPADHQGYIEVFGGGASVLFAKDPEGFEVYNDFNSDLVNLFLCVRNQPLALIKALDCFPLNSREEFFLLRDFLERTDTQQKYDKQIACEIELAKELFREADSKILLEILSERTELYHVERAAAFYKLQRYSYASGGRSFGSQPCNIKDTFEGIKAASRRLQAVIIENQDFERLIKHYDKEKIFIYCDPPYVEAEGIYKVDFLYENHRRLRDVLAGVKGYFLLSYNDCSYVRELYHEFYITPLVRPNVMAQRYQNGDKEYKEVLIANYDMDAVIQKPRQISLFQDSTFIESE